MAVRRPQFELGVTRGAQPREVVVAPRIEVDACQGLSVAAIEPLGKPDHRREHAHRPSLGAFEIPVALVRLLRRRLAMIAGDEGDDFDLLRIETAEIAVLDQVVRVPVMPLVADMHADVVQHGAELEPLSLAIAESVHALRLVENIERQARHLGGVLGPVAAALSKFDDAAAANIGVALDFLDPRAVAMDVVEDDAFSQREIAER